MDEVRSLVGQCGHKRTGPPAAGREERPPATQDEAANEFKRVKTSSDEPTVAEEESSMMTTREGTVSTTGPSSSNTSAGAEPPKKTKAERKAEKGSRLDWSKVRKRHIALQVAYVGEKYAGFAVQTQGVDTVESCLFQALVKTSLVPDPATLRRMQQEYVTQMEAKQGYRERPEKPKPKEATADTSSSNSSSTGTSLLRPGSCSSANKKQQDANLSPSANSAEMLSLLQQVCNYSRCGRTDRGVSARAQILALDVRSNFPFTNELKRELEAAQAAGELSSAATKFLMSLASDSQAEVKSGSNKSKLPSVDALIPKSSEAIAKLERSVKGLVPQGNLCSAVQATTVFSRMGGFHTSEEELQKAQDESGFVLRTGRDSISVTAASETSSADEHNDPELTSWDLDSLEIDYVGLLNATLPKDIRVLAWAPVELGFNARFSCDARVYKYFFYADGMNIEAMNKAAQYLVGDHDFRNLCKMDIVNLKHFHRRILAAAVVPSDRRDLQGTSDHSPSVFTQSVLTGCYPQEMKAITSDAATSTSHAEEIVLNGTVYTYDRVWSRKEPVLYPGDRTLSSTESEPAILRYLPTPQTLAAPVTTPSPFVEYDADNKTVAAKLAPNSLCEVVLVGEAFLYHQVRCIVSVLFMVGRGLEQPEIVRDLLDVENGFRSKPHYTMAPDTPLVLWDAFYPNLRWRISTKALPRLMVALQEAQRTHEINAALFESLYRSLIPTARSLPYGPWEKAQYAPFSSCCHAKPQGQEEVGAKPDDDRPLVVPDALDSRYLRSLFGCKRLGDISAHSTTERKDDLSEPRCSCSIGSRTHARPLEIIQTVPHPGMCRSPLYTYECFPDVLAAAKQTTDPNSTSAEDAMTEIEHTLDEAQQAIDDDEHDEGSSRRYYMPGNRASSAITAMVAQLDKQGKLYKLERQRRLLGRVSPTFHPYVPQDFPLLVAYAATCAQLEPNLCYKQAGRRTQLTLQELAQYPSVQNFPYFELGNHKPLKERPLDASLETRLLALSDKKQAKRNHAEAFAAWLNEVAGHARHNTAAPGDKQSATTTSTRDHTSDDI